MVGVLPDITKRATLGLKGEEQALYLLGELGDTIGASQYLETVHGLEAGQVPPLDLALEQRVIDGTLALIRAGLTDTAHDCAEGGLSVTLTEMALAGNIGLNVELKTDARADAALFGEAHSRVVVAISDPADTDDAESILSGLGVPFTRLGESGGERVTIKLPSQHVELSVNLSELRDAYEVPLKMVLA